MTTESIQKGEHLSLVANRLSLFGMKGLKLSNGNWAIDFGLGVPTEVEPAPAAAEILELINADIRDGNGTAIAKVQIAPQIGIRLFLEGILRRQDIEAAVVEGNRVLFQAVPLRTAVGEKTFCLLVTPDCAYQALTLDADGQII